MAESDHELPGDPSCVLASLAQRLAREGWTVTTRTGPLLQARRSGRFLSLTVLSSAHGTRVHAEGSRSAVAHFRKAIAPEGKPPKEFLVERRGRHFGAAIIAGLSLSATAGVLLFSAFCQSPPPSDLTTAMSGPAPVANLAPALEGLAHTPVPPSATRVLPKPTPAPARAKASRPSPQPTPSPAVPSVTPTAPEPTAAAAPSQAAPTPSAPIRATVTPTIAPERSKPSPTRVPPTPTIDLSRLADAQ